MASEVVVPPLPPEIAQLLISYPPPLWLAHTPVWLVPYALYDGHYAGQTDTIYLSVGRAQYDGRQLSAKAFRHTGRWSRMSEELPLHRVCDLALWVALTLFSRGSDVHVPPGTFYRQSQALTVNNLADGPDYQARQLRALLDDFLGGRGQEDSDYEVVRGRLIALKNTLNAIDL